MVCQEKSICFISPFMGPLLTEEAREGTGGAERQFYLFGKSLADRGWKVTFIADCLTPVRKIHNNVRIIHVPFTHLGGSKFRMLTELPLLTFAILRVRPRYVVLKTATHLAGIVLLCRLLIRCKLILWAQTSTSFSRGIDGEPIWVQRLRWLGIRRAKLLVAQTEQQARAAKMDFGRQACIVRNVAIQEFTQESADKEYVCWCGNGLPNKRAEIFLELAKLMPEEKFVMAMNGDALSERYQSIRKEAEVIKNLRFLGSVSASEMDRWFAGAKVYVNTSIREGFPNTFLHAWQHGCPVVSVDIDPDGILEKENIGLCLYENNTHLMASFEEIAKKLKICLEQLVCDHQKLARYDVTCRQYVERTHSEAVVVEKLEKLLL